MVLTDISTYSIIVWIAAAITASFGLVVYIGGSNLSSRAFLVTVVSMACWTASVGAFIAAADVPVATYLVKLAYFLGTAVASSFFFFFLVYPDNKKPRLILWIVVPAIALAMGYAYFFTDAIIGQAYFTGGIVRYGWSFGPYWPAFYLIFYGLFLTGPVVAFRKAWLTTDMRVKRNVLYMTIGILVAVTPPTFMNIILPQFGYFGLIWLGPILSLVWVSIIAYSIVKYRQLDIRAFTTEILNISLIIIFFANIFNSFSGSVTGRALTFLVFLVISYYIIRLGSRVNDLNHSLQAKVAEQTKEIRGLYEIEKKARVELERLNEAKDQFIMVTQHHLRTPLTQIKWYLESLRDEKAAPSGAESSAGGGSIGEALGSVDRLNRLLDNFLDIAQLQVGKGILKLEKASLLPIAEDILKELSDETKRMRLSIEYDRSSKAWPEVPLDRQKMREALFILLQNAVKYNVEGGTIRLVPRAVDGMFRLAVSNTGIGIEKSEQDKLLKEIFTRGSSAVKANPLGMGMGLTLARYIIEAHRGSIAVESEGAGQGARVVIELPLELS